MLSVRKSAVNGIFYPASCRELERTIDNFNKRLESLSFDKTLLRLKPDALIVPHAGYIYSGFTANFAYRFARFRRPKRVIVIGPSHHYYFRGISAAYYEAIETPCGTIPIDTPYLFALAQRFPIGFIPKAHAKEHSTEVQMPFVKHYFPNAEIIEIVYGDTDVALLAQIVEALLTNEENLTIISSDLSHYYPIEKAELLDSFCLKAVRDLDVKLLKRCEACGKMGIAAMVRAARKTKRRSLLLDYRTSAEASGDTASVVGYMSALFYRSHSLAINSASKI